MAMDMDSLHSLSHLMKMWQTNRDLGTQRFQSGVVDVMVNFSAPVTVRGEPYLDMAVSERA